MLSYLVHHWRTVCEVLDYGNPEKEVFIRSYPKLSYILQVNALMIMRVIEGQRLMEDTAMARMRRLKTPSLNGI